MYHENAYLEVLRNILNNGFFDGDRTGVGTQSLFGEKMEFDMANGFPLLTTKKVNFKNILVELLWFIKGDTNIRYLLENDCHIWTEWPLKAYLDSVGELDQYYEEGKYVFTKEIIEWFENQIITNDLFASMYGDCGDAYGKQWRRFEGIENHHEGEAILNKITEVDQLKNVIETLKKKPTDRRMIVSAWNPPQIESAALPPCHCLFQFKTHPNKEDENKRFLSLMMYQRSCDMFLGVPYNIASYSLLLHIVAKMVDMIPYKYTHILGDAHIYNNHFSQVETQLSRTPVGFPDIEVKVKRDRIEDYQIGDFELKNYNPHGFIKAPIAV